MFSGPLSVLTSKNLLKSCVEWFWATQNFWVYIELLWPWGNTNLSNQRILLLLSAPIVWVTSCAGSCYYYFNVWAVVGAQCRLRPKICTVHGPELIEKKCKTIHYIQIKGGLLDCQLIARRSHNRVWSYLFSPCLCGFSVGTPAAPPPNQTKLQSSSLEGHQSKC